VVRIDENKEEPGWNIGWVVKNFPVPCLKSGGNRYLYKGICALLSFT
jgi:hypothetical protein